VELFRVTSRVVAGGSGLAARWRGPLADEEAGPPPSAFYDELVTGPGRVTFLVATRGDGVSDAVRAALYRNAELDAEFPPVLSTPDAEAVRAGALQASLRELGERPIRHLAVDLLGVGGSAMPEGLRVVTEAIARAGRAERPARWIVLIDPLYERRIGRWSAPEFFGEARLAHAAPVEWISLRSEVEPGVGRLRVVALGDLVAIYLGLANQREPGGGVDRLRDDLVHTQRLVDASLAGLDGGELVEVERRVELASDLERLLRPLLDYRSQRIGREEFLDTTLESLAALRREQPDDALPAAELLAALADSHPIEPVPVPEGAGFVETLGRPPAVQRM
jgi:hypothetical protein